MDVINKKPGAYGVNRVAKGYTLEEEGNILHRTFSYVTHPAMSDGQARKEVTRYTWSKIGVVMAKGGCVT